MTGSGFDKGHLRPENFLLVDGAGSALTAPAPKPSAAARLHVALAENAGAGAILHTHSVAATVLSAAAVSTGKLRLAGFEMLKGLAGITTHDSTVDLAVFPNTQDIPALAATPATRLTDPVNPLRHGFLLAGHGLYTWGEDLAAARRHVGVLEFLFEVLTRQAALPSLR
jgi:methylthioribulose-1-phosphate dehydratase